MWMLHSDDGANGSETFRLSRSAMTMGRSPGADFVLDAALVSRLHCRFSVSGDGAVTVEDLGSTNGTFVNDERVAQSQLAAGDRVRVGRVEMTVSWDER